MNAPKSQKQTVKEDIDVCRCTTQTIKYMENIKKSLSEAQIESADDYIKKKKAELIAWVESTTLDQLAAFNKKRSLDVLSDEAITALPDIPRDFFKRSFHYVLNGVQTRVQNQKGYLKMHPPRDASSSTTTASSSSSSSSVEDGQTDEGSDPDKTIVEATQHIEESSPAGSPSSRGDVHVADTDDHEAATQLKYCVTTCLKGGEQGDWEMVRCILCMRWYHQQCCDATEDAQYKSASWCCPLCRRMPADISLLKKQVTKLTDMLLSVHTLLKKQARCAAKEVEVDADIPTTNNDMLPESTAPMTQSLAAVATEPSTPNRMEQSEQSLNALADVTSPRIDALLSCHNRFSSLYDTQESDTDIAPDTPSSHSDVITPPPNQQKWKCVCRRKGEKRKPVTERRISGAFKATVLSDSMLRKVDVLRVEKLSSDTNSELIFVQDADNIDAAIRSIQGKAISRRDPLIIHTGTNHVQRESVNSITRRLEHLESSLLYQRYQRVALSSVVYRRSNWFVREKITAVNDIILAICTRNGWTYIDNDNVDESCIEHGDSVHPNRYGTERMAHNLATGLRHMILQPSYMTY